MITEAQAKLLTDQVKGMISLWGQSHRAYGELLLELLIPAIANEDAAAFDVIKRLVRAKTTKRGQMAARAVFDFFRAVFAAKTGIEIPAFDDGGKP